MIITDIEKLKQISEPVSLSEAPEIINLLDTELALANKLGHYGIGLAAPQIGIYKQVAIVRIGDIKINLVNAEVLDKRLRVIGTEGCLSLPDKSCRVERFNEIVVLNQSNFSDFDEKIPIKFVAYGIPAICVQHELNHLDGVLITDISLPEHRDIPSGGPNEKCPCGSGKKFKKCCGGFNGR